MLCSPVLGSIVKKGTASSGLIFAAKTGSEVLTNLPTISIYPVSLTSLIAFSICSSISPKVTAYPSGFCCSNVVLSCKYLVIIMPAWPG